MEDKLYYEKKNITTATEVKEAHDYAVEYNYKYYRAVTERGAIFGWVDGKHAKATEGQEWFENPEYKETAINEALLEEPITEPLLERVAEPANVIMGAVGEIPETKDYKALYEEAALELEQCKTECMTVSAELNAIKKAFAVIAAEIEVAKNAEE